MKGTGTWPVISTISSYNLKTCPLILHSYVTLHPISFKNLMHKNCIQIFLSVCVPFLPFLSIFIFYVKLLKRDSATRFLLTNFSIKQSSKPTKFESNWRFFLSITGEDATRDNKLSIRVLR